MLHSDANRPRLVVAEDDDAVLELLRMRLEFAGYAVSYARDGVAALEVIRNVRPAAIILDLNMPLLDGFGVLEALRQRRQIHLAPIMVLTARHAVEDVKRCITLGAKDYLAKPFSDRALVARVERLVRPPPRRADGGLASGAAIQLD